MKFLVALVICCAGSARGAPPLVLPPSPAWVTISASELRDRYDTVWAVSDVHGRLHELEQLLLAAGLAARTEGGQLAWTAGRGRQLLVVVGDCIDGGPDSVGVVLLFRTLQTQAALAGSRTIVLLGNHEVDFLYKPRSASPELLASAARAGLQLSRKRVGEQLAQGDFGRFLREMPVAAFIGPWMFAHAGYLDVEQNSGGLQELFARIADGWARGDRERYGLLREPRSLVAYHDWWKSSHRRKRMKAHLAELGVDALVFGHDPDAFGAQGTIATDSSGRLIKLDTGLKTSRSAGMLLRCDVASASGSTRCRAMTPDGGLRDLPSN